MTARPGTGRARASRRELYPSLDAMLSLAALSSLAGTPIAAVRRVPFHSVDSLSGSRFFAVETDRGPDARFIVKRISLEWDWIMRATDDDRARAVVAWQSGLLDALPPEIVHGTLAGARDGAGWALLLQDAGPALVPPGDEPIAIEDHERILEAMTALHATCWGQVDLASPDLGFLDLPTRYRALSPATSRREEGGPDPVPPLIAQGWALAPSLLRPEVAALVCGLLDDPRPLAGALARFPATVVHGDWKLGNLGIARDGSARVVLLDWAAIGPAPPGVDLAWYLAVNSARLPVGRETVIARYREGLARRLGPRFREDWWLPQLELALLGGFLQLGWDKLLGAARGESAAVRAREQAELAWWSERVLAGARWL